MHEFRAQFDGVFERGVLLGKDASADAVAGLEDCNSHSRACEIQRSGEAGDAGADNDDVRSHRKLDADAVRRECEDRWG